jgi:hypothetical protein
MRSTKASAAVARLNARDSENRYSLGMTAGGFFYLLRAAGSGPQEKISSPIEPARNRKRGSASWMLRSRSSWGTGTGKNDGCGGAGVIHSCATQPRMSEAMPANDQNL